MSSLGNKNIFKITASSMDDPDTFISNLLKLKPITSKSQITKFDNKYYKILQKNRKENDDIKNRLDTYNLAEANRITHGRDAFQKAKKDIELKYGLKSVTNAWLKMWELNKEFSLSNRNGINLFDNASMPGAFILAMDYYASSNNIKFNWMASSLLGGEALGDTYCIYKHNPSHYIMTPENNGDVLSKKLTQDIIKKVKKVNLYTADIAGSAAIHGYALEEENNLPLNCGQIIGALVSMEVGGHAVFKSFTYSHMMSLNLIDILAHLWKEVFITKPITSRPLNSETYFVCKGFLGSKKIMDLVKLLENYIDKKYEYLYLITDQDFMKSVVDSDVIHTDQTKLLNKVINEYIVLDTIKQEHKNFRQKCKDTRFTPTAKHKTFADWSKDCYKELKVIETKYFEKLNAQQDIINKDKEIVYKNWLAWAKLRPPKYASIYTFKVGCMN